LFAINSILAKNLSPKIEIFSFDMEKGCLGFFDPRIALFTFLPFGLLCAVMGSAGYVACLIYYSPLVVSNAYLVEPFIAQLLGFYLGFDNCPGPFTILGSILTIMGIVFIERATQVKSGKVEERKDSDERISIDEENSYAKV
jgi:drug/metabolite transporter (DMT)-like permease